MREILFRGRPDDGSDWVFGDLIHRRICKYDIVIIRTEDSGFDNYNEYEVVPETVGQYTGLTDKNGTKVFEGDIVTRYFDDFGLIEYEVEFDQGEFLLIPIEDRTDTWAIRISGESEITVIGNIHDNTELLGGADNG